MYSREDLAVIAKTCLFADLSAAEVEALLGKDELTIGTFQSGEIIYDPAHFSHCLGILLAGKAEVRKIREQGVPLTMSSLEVGDIFGMAAVFYRRDTYLTEIKAVHDCRIIFFSQEVLERFFLEKPVLALSYIKLLSERIHFLNGKIQAFTGYDTQSRLVAFLWENADQETGIVALPYSIKSLGERLNIGRASLYRAFDALEAMGSIQREGKQIRILDFQLLKK